jgi:hypothetical protein
VAADQTKMSVTVFVINNRGAAGSVGLCNRENLEKSREGLGRRKEAK